MGRVSFRHPLRRLLAGLTTLLAVGAFGLGSGLGVPGAPAAGMVARTVPVPLIWQVDFADPSVADSGNGYIATATGLAVPRMAAPEVTGPWQPQPPALAAVPSWVLPGHLWAADLTKVPDGWVLYYSAPVGGLHGAARCIGAAHSRRATGPFLPISDRPLVCPAGALAPPAEDPLPGVGMSAGVIDPSVFVDTDGKRYLFYKTQTRPSTIRMVQLTARGAHVARGQVSLRLLRDKGITENPVVVRHRDRYVLFTSQGSYLTCGYRTTWRRSRSLTDWSGTTPKPLLTSAGTGLCGPGGADAVDSDYGSPTRIFFHGWVCDNTPTPCPLGFNAADPNAPLHRRAMYGARLTWTSAGAPRIAAFLIPTPQ